MKKWILLLVLCMLPLSALALDDADWIWFSLDGESLEEALEGPVWLAPFESAPQMESAVVESVSGRIMDGGWRMGQTAAGQIVWIPASPLLPETGTDDITITRMLCTVTRDCSASLIPENDAEPLLSVPQGAQVIYMATLEDLAYVETESDGKPVWLFMPVDALEAVPVVFVSGGTLSFDPRVTVLEYATVYEDTFEYDEDGDYTWSTRIRTHVMPGDVAVNVTELPDNTDPEEGEEEIRAVILPENLRVLGSEILCYMHLSELRLPDSLREMDPEALYSCTVDRLILSRGCTADVMPEGSVIGAYEVEEGNPRYTAPDGVLLSGDGSVLFRYPSGRKDTHYDVPAGVRQIADRAFYSDAMDLPLRTLSLPLGLESIGEYAFSGCGELISLTVPLTVTDLAPTAFHNCVSLERLSLPPGLEASFDGYAQQADFTYFNGDNNETGTLPEDTHRFSWYSAWVDNPQGEGEETLYRDRECRYPCKTLPVGTPVTVRSVQGDMAMVETGKFSDPECWIPLRFLTPLTRETLFDLMGVRIHATGVFVENDFDDVILSHQRVRVCGEGEDGKYVWDYFDLSQVTLLRSGTNDRVLGYLSAPEGTAIRFLDAPGGTEIGHLFDPVQAIILEEREGMTHVRTLRLNGWVPSALVFPAEILNP